MNLKFKTPKETYTEGVLNHLLIDKEDLNLFLMTDYVDQAFEFISCILKEKCLDNPTLHI